MIQNLLLTGALIALLTGCSGNKRGSMGRFWFLFKW